LINNGFRVSVIDGTFERIVASLAPRHRNSSQNVEKNRGHFRLNQPAGVHILGTMVIADDDGVDQPENSGQFTRTHWSVVLRARDDSTTALDTLFSKYRRPMIIYALNWRKDDAWAEDVVQSFCAYLIRPDKRHFLANVDQQKGKFRTFLLTSLQHFIIDHIKTERSQKRGGGKVPDSLDETDSDGVVVHSPKSSALSADLEYDKAWAQMIVRNALRQLEEAYAAKGKSQFYQAIEPVIHHDETSPLYRDIAARFGMTEGAVKVAVHEMRRRLRQLTREEIKQTVKDKNEFKDELAYLLNLLSPPTA
jgi:RNA polymerase sigma factor (sigma-70 family)